MSSKIDLESALKVFDEEASLIRKELSSTPILDFVKEVTLREKLTTVLKLKIKLTELEEKS